MSDRDYGWVNDVDRERASIARHGGRFLTQAIAERLRPHDGPAARVGLTWVSMPQFIAILAGKEGPERVRQAWDWIDGRMPTHSGPRWSEHVAEIRSHGRDASRREYLDEAIHWPVIRIALGLPL